MSKCWSREGGWSRGGGRSPGDRWSRRGRVRRKRSKERPAAENAPINEQGYSKGKIRPSKMVQEGLLKRTTALLLHSSLGPARERPALQPSEWKQRGKGGDLGIRKKTCFQRHRLLKTVNIHLQMYLLTSKILKITQKLFSLPVF